MAIIDRGNGASRRVRGRGRGKEWRLGRHTSVSACGNPSEEHQSGSNAKAGLNDLTRNPEILPHHRGSPTTGVLS